MSKREAKPTTAEPPSVANGAPAGKVQSLTDIDAEIKKALYDTGKFPLITTVMGKVEEQTGVKREKFAYGVLGALGLYLIVGSLAQLVCNFIGFAYPAYASVYAIRSTQKDDDTQWLIYWTCFAAFSLVDFFAEKICSWFPIYWLVKALFLVWLSAPQTGGALKMYENVVDPAIKKVDEIYSKYAGKKE
ncbi:unnamed protein product [Bursaphelenchus okinawaensis]|uniref:Receptor expression-enhancing protein n=1 Tax=Bursaphelenchus okinawaensis TaxID=465554 RepID=A0A811LD12_9BILA|nr:unnamed protein product [Bursaphelenchus okinawaensis]CAG9121086.1 unnamed protein product [Bursaphelenchus okinawaensis]